MDIPITPLFTALLKDITEYLPEILGKTKMVPLLSPLRNNPKTRETPTKMGNSVEITLRPLRGLDPQKYYDSNQGRREFAEWNTTQASK